MKNLQKTIKYLFIFNLILLLGCDASNITNSNIKSAEIGFQNIGTWNGPYAYFGSDVQTDHSVIQGGLTGALVYFTRNSNNKIYVGSLNTNLSSSRAPSVVSTSCYDFITYRSSGSSNVLNYAKYQSGTPSSGQIPSGSGYATSSTGPASIRIGSKIVVYHKGENNNNIYERIASFLSCSTNFSDPNNWTASQVSGANTNTTPSATVFNNKVYLFYKGPSSNTIYYRYRSTGGSTWSSEFSLSSSSQTPSTPTVRTIDNQLFLVYQGTDDKIYYRIMDTNGNWSSIKSTSGSASTNRAPDISLGDGTEGNLRISYRDQGTNRPLYIQASY